MSGIGYSTVAILGPRDNVPSGTGVLVGPRHVLTCAHVVGDALGDRHNEPVAKSETAPTQVLRVRFSVADRPTTLTGRVMRWSRYYERAELALDAAADLFATRDLALLELDQDPPSLAKPVRFCSPVDTIRQDRLFKNRELEAAGYPKIGSDAFHALRFAYDSRTDGDEMMVGQAEGDFDEDDLSGLSGAGLVMKDCSLVVGLVMEVGTERHLVVVKPARHLHLFWEDLRLVIHGSELREYEKVPDQLILDIDRDPHRNALSKAAVDTAAAGSGVMLATILGRTADRVDEWIDFLVTEVIQYKLDVQLNEWVETIRPITVYRKRGLDGDDLFRMAMNQLYRKLGLRSADVGVDQVRSALNGDQIDGQGRMEPPPYLIYQFSAHSFAETETQVLGRLIRFWNEVAQGDLERIQLVFFTLVTKQLDADSGSGDLENICATLRENFTGPQTVHILDPVPGVCMEDAIAWIRLYEEELNDLWRLDAKTAKLYCRVVKDIFTYEASGRPLPLRGFQMELDKLALCQKCLEV